MFQATFIPSGSSTPDIVGKAGTITAKDHSTYGAEIGHDLVDFSQYKLVKLLLPTGDSLYLGTTAAVAYNNVVPVSFIGPPSVELPDMAFDYSRLGDQIYDLSMEVVPTWNALASYEVVNTPYVFLSGVIYQNIADSLGDNPASSPTKWAVATALPAKYLTEVKWSVTYDAEVKWIGYVRQASQQLNVEDFRLTSKNTPFSKAARLNLILNAIGVKTGARDWDGCEMLINYSKTL